MKREDLKKLLGDSATDETIDAIMGMNGKDIESHKNKLAETETARDQFKAQLDEANQQIESFKGMNIDDIKKNADEWKTKFEQAQADHAKELVNMQFDKDFETALTGAKVKYSNEVKARLKLDELKDDKGKFIAERFTEQIGKLKTDATDLFESDKPTPKIVTKSNNQPIVGDAMTEAARKAAGLTPATEGK